MNTLNEIELMQIQGGNGDGALTVFGAQLAADGLNHANSGNPAVAAVGVVVAAAGGWAWAIGSFCDGISSMFD